MIDPIKVAQAVEKFKLPIVCATCTKYWKARDKGLPEPQCLANDGCASPIGGGNFHEYEGPLPDFTIWCFVCGGQATKQMFIKGKPRLFGICDLHLEEAQSLGPSHINDPAVLQRYYIERGETKPLNPPIFMKKQTLKELINESEGYEAKKAGRIWIDV